MTVRQLFYASTDFDYGDIVTIKCIGKTLYKAEFIDVLTTVYAEYTVMMFSVKNGVIDVF